MKAIFYSLIVSLSLISCSHNSFDEIACYDMKICEATCKISTDIRDDISGTHYEAYKDILNITTDFIENYNDETDYYFHMISHLNRKYPYETIEIVTDNVMEIYEDASDIMYEDGFCIMPLLSVENILDNALKLSENSCRPFKISITEK